VRSVDASIEFTRDVLDAFDKISQSPLRWPECLHGTRRFILRRFPFAIVYLNEKDTLDIVALAHASRKPGYWQHRL
jgi:plasmid stabilization system protein ParE